MNAQFWNNWLWNVINDLMMGKDLCLLLFSRTNVRTNIILPLHSFFCLLFSEPFHPHPPSKVVYEWPQIQTKTMSDTCLKASLEMFWKKLNFKAEPLDRFDDK